MEHLESRCLILVDFVASLPVDAKVCQLVSHLCCNPVSCSFERRMFLMFIQVPYPGSILVITTLTFWKDLYFSYTDFSIPCISWAHSCKTQVILISMCVQDPRLSPAQKAEVEAEVEAEVCVTTFFTIQLSNLKMYNCTNAKKKANWYMY